MAQTQNDTSNLNRIKRQIKIYKIVTAILLLAIAANVLFYFRVKNSLNEVGRIGETHITFMSPLIFYVGSIGEDAMNRLIQGIDAEPKKEYDMLLISSNGGNGTEAEQLARLLNQKGITFHVGEDALCASACVPAFLHTERRFAAPSARFNFHQGEALLIRWAHVPHLLLHGDWPKEPVSMVEWVKEISPRLEDYFNQCSAGNPLSNEHGLTMTWQDVELVVKGTPRRSCDDALADEPRRGL